MDLGTIFGAIDLNTGPFQAGLSRSLVQLNGWKGAALKVAGVVGATFGTLAVAGFVKNSISAFADFESNLNQVAAATKTPAAGMKELSDLAMKMGRDTAFSAGEASAAMLELAKSGMTPAEIKGGALAATMKLAAAEGMSLETAAVRTSNAMNMFGLKAKDANQVANALAGGALASSASVDSLALGLSQVGPGAKNAGMSLQETVAVLAGFDQAGIKGSDAGTSLKTMLSSLIPTSNSAADAMREVGLMTEDGTNAFINADGSFKNISQIAGLLQGKLKGLSEAQRSAALTAIFGADASKAAGRLMDLGTKGVQRYIKATSDKTAADEMAEARMKGLKGAFESLGGSVETLGLKFVSAFGPALTAAVLGLVAVVNNLSGALGPVGAAFETAFGFLGDHQTAVTIIAGTILTLLAPAFIVLAAQATASAAASTAAWLATKAQAAASAAMHVLSLTLIGLSWLRTAAQAAAGAAAQAGAWLLARLQVIPTMILYGIAFAMMAAGWVATAAAAMAGAAATAAAWLLAIWPIVLVVAAIALVVVLVIKYWDQISAAFSAGVDAVVGFVQGLPDKIKGFFSDAGSWLKTVGEDIMNGLVAGIEKGFNWVRDKLRGVGRLIPGWLKSVLGITSPSKVMRDQVGVWIPAGVAEGIDDGIPDVTAAARRMGLASVIPITAAPSLRVPGLGTSAATSFGSRSATGTEGSQGPLIEQHVHPQPGMSEREVGVQAGNQALAALARAGARL